MDYKTQQAITSLQRLRQSLQEWLKYKTLLTLGAQGKIPGGNPAKAAAFLNASVPEETALNKKLTELLVESDYKGNIPTDTVQLVQVVLGMSTEQSASENLGIWPLVIAGVAAVWVISSVAGNIADVAKEKRRYQCIESGYCSDMSGWWKWGLLAVAGYFVVTKTQVGDWLSRGWAFGEKAYPHVRAGLRQARKRA